jgi:hypothetical protein
MALIALVKMQEMARQWRNTLSTNRTPWLTLDSVESSWVLVILLRTNTAEKRMAFDRVAIDGIATLAVVTDNLLERQPWQGSA